MRNLFNYQLHNTPEDAGYVAMITEEADKFKAFKLSLTQAGVVGQAARDQLTLEYLKKERAPIHEAIMALRRREDKHDRYSIGELWFVSAYTQSNTLTVATQALRYGVRCNFDAIDWHMFKIDPADKAETETQLHTLTPL